MKVFITGGAGFIGSHLAQKYLAQGNEVMIVDNMSTGKRIVKGAKFAQVDILHQNQLKRVMKKYQPDIVCHLAATLGVKRVNEQPIKTWKTNVLGTMNVLNAARKIKSLQKILNVSTSSIYGDNDRNPKQESFPPEPHEVYSISKTAGEAYCQALFEEFDLPISTVRPFNIYGPFQDSTPYGFVIAIFIQNLLKGKPLTIFGDGNQIRDFLYVDDCVNGMIKVVDKGTDGEVYNLSGGYPIRIIDLAHKLQEMIPSTNYNIKYLPKRKNDIYQRWGSNVKMQSLGWKPTFDLERGLTNTIEYFRGKQTNGD